MTGHPHVLDVRELPAIAFMKRSPIFWAAMGSVLIEGTVFALVIASYYYVRTNMMDVWPPPGNQRPGLWLPVAEMILLLLSVPPAWLSTETNKKAERLKTIIYLTLNLIFGLAAMVCRTVEWAGLNFNWKTDIHGSLVWLALVSHTFEVGVSLIMTVILIGILLTPAYGPATRKAVDFDSIIWVFLVAIWIPLSATLFLAPYFMSA